MQHRTGTVEPAFPGYRHARSNAYNALNQKLVSHRKDAQYAEILKSKKTLYPRIKRISVIFSD
jgi:hypothetical protein